jgi:solute carrier family 25 oxoglutarate transporter 11
MPTAEDSILRTIQPFVCGGSAAMTASTCIHPIDITKVRLQLVGEGHKGARPSALSIARGIVKADGVAGLYAGLSAAVMRQAVYGTARIGLYRTVSQALVDRNGDGKPLPFLQKAGASLSTGAVASAIGNPFDLALVRMQSDTMKPAAERRNYKSVFDAIIRVSKEEGVARLWRGSAPTILRAMCMNMGMMASYDQVKETIVAIRGDSFSTQLMSSAAAGFFAAFASLPMDLLKTRLQNMKPDASGRLPYKGVADAFVKVLTKEGPLAFWSGFGAYYGRTAPHAMIILMTLESFTNAYSKFVLGDE